MTVSQAGYSNFVQTGGKRVKFCTHIKCFIWWTMDKGPSYIWSCRSSIYPKI